MHKPLKLTYIILLAMLLPGCFIQSFQPFYTEAVVLELPATLGNWYLVTQGDEVVADDYPEPWGFGRDQITTVEDGIHAELVAKYFRVNKVNYIDFSPSDEYESINAWWKMHTVPVHSVCKVVMSADRMSLIPLDGEWVAEMLEEEEISLSYLTVDSEEDHIVLTAPSEELVSFLKRYGSNEYAFPIENAHVFQRTKYRKPPEGERE